MSSIISIFWMTTELFILLINTFKIDIKKMFILFIYK